ncbi:hypothetical protein LWI28_019061 [Acer negundo]|uniref:Uncharacterized protein n=1 Tax=Acer negundo TaxID=4023 RepID=A0AAD5J6U6_ACENE|nr:hypothetical protein LWI28_019061 [Acer negundo]KAK4850028.1 hypothetical protein QYF36_003204 [Acer negundo]
MSKQATTPKSGPKKLSTSASLSNLLPTGTFLAFEALLPSFSNNGDCQLPAHKYLTLSIIVGFSLVCFFSSFIDSIKIKGKVYYGVATPRGLFVFNKEVTDDDDDQEKGDAQKKNGCCSTSKKDSDLYKYRIRLIDFVHALSSLLVFLVFATSNSDVQRCVFPRPTANGNALMINLPLLVGGAMSFLFMLFPTKRRGIGYPKQNAKPKKADTGEPKKARTEEIS